MNILTETQVRLFASAQCWIEGEAAVPLSIAVNSLSATADMQLIRQTEELLKGEAGGRQ